MIDNQFSGMFSILAAKKQIAYSYFSTGLIVFCSKQVYKNVLESTCKSTYLYVIQKACINLNIVNKMFLKMHKYFGQRFFKKENMEANVNMGLQSD